MIKKILFPTDESQHSQRAMSYAVELANKFGAEIVLLHVYQIPKDFSEFAASYEEAANYLRNYTIKRARFITEEARKSIELKGVKVSTLYKEGKPGPIIAEVLVQEHCDMIVMGSRGLGTVEGALLGSVSNYILHHCKCPVFLAR